MALDVAVPALLGVGFAGFLVGLFSFRVKSRWCTQCGRVKRCPACAHVGSRHPGAGRHSHVYSGRSA
jgi:hypothetical protein